MSGRVESYTTYWDIDKDVEWEIRANVREVSEAWCSRARQFLVEDIQVRRMGLSLLGRARGWSEASDHIEVFTDEVMSKVEESLIGDR